jgi:hypothetical protein
MSTPGSIIPPTLHPYMFRVYRLYSPTNSERPYVKYLFLSLHIPRRLPLLTLALRTRHSRL